VELEGDDQNPPRDISGQRQAIMGYFPSKGYLEFFEKLAAMFKLSGDMRFIYESTLGWYAAHYFIFARAHGQIDALRKLWGEHLYDDLEKFYNFYLAREAGRSRKAQKKWEAKRLATEDKFWEQERKD
jgi:hypothetical protein